MVETLWDYGYSEPDYKLNSATQTHLFEPNRHTKKETDYNTLDEI